MVNRRWKRSSSARGTARRVRRLASSRPTTNTLRVRTLTDGSRDRGSEPAVYPGGEQAYGDSPDGVRPSGWTGPYRERPASAPRPLMCEQHDEADAVS